MTSRSLVHVIDLLTGQKYTLIPSAVRVMTVDEIEQYNETPGASDPLPEEIQDYANDIRSSWTQEEAMRRKRSVNEFLSIFKN